MASGFVGIAVDMVDPVGIERTAAANNAVDFVALGEQQFGQVRTVLSGDAGDQCFFGGGHFISWAWLGCFYWNVKLLV